MTLKDGKTGMVLRVDSIAESGLKERLMTMGLLPGTKISVLRSAPLGDPMAIGLRQGRWRGAEHSFGVKKANRRNQRG